MFLYVCVYVCACVCVCMCVCDLAFLFFLYLPCLLASNNKTPKGMAKSYGVLPAQNSVFFFFLFFFFFLIPVYSCVRISLKDLVKPGCCN